MGMGSIGNGLGVGGLDEFVIVVGNWMGILIC